MPAYSFGDVMNDVTLEPVNALRFQIKSGAWRVPEVEVSPGGSPEEEIAVITLTDLQQGSDGKVLAGTITCNLTSGGITVNTQHMGGMELERQEEVIMALRRGAPLTFNIDFSACSMVGQGRGTWRTLSANASELWASCISGYRVPHKAEGSVEFTSVLVQPKQREIFNMRLQPQDQVLVKAYAVSHSTSEPTAVATFNCQMGTSGAVHNIFAGLMSLIEPLEPAKCLPKENIVSCLMDNCNVMRGKKGGLETLIRDEQPHLIDVHGDTVHIVSNAAKEFCKPFSNYLEGFASDVYYDFKLSPKEDF
ncbi:hypothetical protein ACOMHN_035256 [Nucella lapillus]